MARTPEVDTNRGCGLRVALLCHCCFVRSKAIHCPFRCLPNILVTIGAASVLLLTVALIDEAAALASNVSLYRDLLSSQRHSNLLHHSLMGITNVGAGSTETRAFVEPIWFLPGRSSSSASRQLRSNQLIPQVFRTGVTHHGRLRKHLPQPIVSLHHYLMMFLKDGRDGGKPRVECCLEADPA